MEIVEEKIIITVEERPVIIRTGNGESGFPVWGEITGELEHQADLKAALDGKSDTGHDHDDRYYTEAEADALLSGKSDTGHDHDDRYYTEAEADALLSGKSDTGHDHDDRYYTKTEIDTALAEKANVITDTVSGNPAFFPDGAGVLPVISLTADIEPVQPGSGDPAPDNVRPISGWTGCTVSRSDGVLTPETVTVNWQPVAGTVYGGTLNLTTGVLTVTRGSVTVDSDTNLTGFVESTYGSYAVLADVITHPLPDSEVDLMCSSAKAVKRDDRASWTNLDKVFQNSRGDIYLRASANAAITDIDGIRTQFSGAQIVYFLPAPVTYQLTAEQMTTLFGENIVSADTGPVTVTYRADTKLYIDKKVAAVEALILDQS